MAFDDSVSESRRKFIKWATTAGIASLFPTTISDIAEAKDEREEPKGVPAEKRGNPSSDVYHRHSTEFPLMQKLLSEYEAEGKPEILYQRELQKFLQRNEDETTVDLFVETMGEQNQITSKGPRQRQIQGWRPTDSEVNILKKFGDIVFVPDFISTKVCIDNVRISDLPDIAQLDFVISLNHRPTPKPDTHTIHKSDLYSNSYYWFDSISTDYNIGTNIRIGILDSGYTNYSWATNYSENHAWDMGIDTQLADSFNSEWATDDGNYHGDTVTDSTAYMLDNGHEDLFVPLKVLGDNSSTVTAAIEFAEANEIQVINMSFSSAWDPTHCPNIYCSELNSYTTAGYIPLSSSGNVDSDSSIEDERREDAPSFPGGGWPCVSVGGIKNGDCTDQDYQKHESSKYGYIEYGECPICTDVSPTDRTGMAVPHVYGCYATETNSGDVAGGTSNATPQAAAAATIMQSNGLYNYNTAEEIFRGMNYFTVCPSSKAQEGQLIDAWDAYYQTN